MMGCYVQRPGIERIETTADMNSKAKIAAAAGVVGLGLTAAQLFRQTPDEAAPRAAGPEPSSLRLRQPREAGEPRVTPSAPFARPAPAEPSANSTIPLANIPAGSTATSPLDGAAAAPRLPREFPSPSAYELHNSASAATPNAGVSSAVSVDSAAPLPHSPSAAANRREAVRHIVIDGDNLADLARRYLGDPARANEILAANRPLISHPDVLPIGIQLLIPGARQAD